jgi:nucleoside transporter
MKPAIRLSLMMFMQYVIWGAWYSTMGSYLGALGFQGSAIGAAYSTTGLAAIISPFFVGMIADRFFPAQKILGILHIAGGLILYAVAQIKDPGLFFWALLLHTLCYMPTLALTNTICFHQMAEPGKEFPKIRVVGTIGWIVVGWAVSLLRIEQSNMQFLLGSALSICMGAYSFTLPNTPPKSVGNKVTWGDILGVKALSLLRDRSFLIFALSSLLICIPLSFYFSFTNFFLNEQGVPNAAGKMTFGQVSEVLFLVVMPFFIARLGVKKMLLTGMLFWVVRYAFFAWGNSTSLISLYYLAILFHGICYDFFFVTGQIYVDKRAPAEVRASAQGFIYFVTLGVGMLIGSYASGLVVEGYQIMDASSRIVGHDWHSIWLLPAGMALVVAVLFAGLFKESGSDRLEATGESR